MSNANTHAPGHRDDSRLDHIETINAAHAARDLIKVADWLATIQAHLAEIQAHDATFRIDAAALETARAAVKALAVDCDASASRLPYIHHAALACHRASAMRAMLPGANA